jgi:pimeloyl-ACP methyl ester carboxylesterase
MMKTFFLVLYMSVSSLGLAQEAIQITSSEDVQVYGEYFPVDKSEFVVLLFHQAGSNAKAEYGEYIIPELMDHGYAVIAVDQRKGGDRLGGVNRTASQVDEAELSYCDAYPDLVSTLEYADRLKKKIVVWGSSYSAALVLKLAVDFPGKIHGVLAFSPAAGGPMGECSANNFVGNVTMPTIAFRPGKEAELTSVKEQMTLFSSNGISTFVSDEGVHGSSMLNPERAQGVDAVWEQVFLFLSGLK